MGARELSKGIYPPSSVCSHHGEWPPPNSHRPPANSEEGGTQGPTCLVTSTGPHIGELHCDCMGQPINDMRLIITIGICSCHLSSIYRSHLLVTHIPLLISSLQTSSASPPLVMDRWPYIEQPTQANTRLSHCYSRKIRCVPTYRTRRVTQHFT